MMISGKRFIAFLVLIIILLLGASPVSGQTIDLHSELAILLSFNGDAEDKSGAGVPTSIFGPLPANDRFGNPNSAYLFDGIDDYIQLNNDNPLITSESFTICMWAKVNGQSLSENKSNTLFVQRDDDANVNTSESIIHGIAEFNGQVWLMLSASGEHIANNNTGCIYSYDDSWHHYAFRFEEDKSTSIFLDGRKYCSGSFNNTGNFTTSIDHVSIGALHYSGVTKGAFHGAIDEVLIYNRALQDCDIETLYSGQASIER